MLYSFLGIYSSVPCNISMAYKLQLHSVVAPELCTDRIDLLKLRFDLSLADDRRGFCPKEGFPLSLSAKSPTIQLASVQCLNGIGTFFTQCAFISKGAF